MREEGKLALVLHAHLPFVRHPEHSRFLEEHWLFEAITDCYLPLLGVLRDAAARGSHFRLSVSLSPTLLSMLADPLLQGRYQGFLSRLIGLCEREMSGPGDGERRALARYYHRRWSKTRAFYLDELRADLIRPWAELAASGSVELTTTAATHAYLPLLRSEPAAVRAQLGVGRDHFTRVFGYAPTGLWLPECGYYPGLEGEVTRAGFRYFVLDAHGLGQTIPPEDPGVYAPRTLPNGAVVFGRDPESSWEVWSREDGYPAHALYREYHHDLGFEADAEGLAGFFPPGVAAAPTGIKYFRVTGGNRPKELYNPFAALRQAQRDAESFLASRRTQLKRLAATGRPPIVIAPYDAELFGHWWFEGPAFLDALIRRLDTRAELETVTLGEYVERYGSASCDGAWASSWGEHGYNSSWLRPETGWVYLHLHQAASDLKYLVRHRHPRQYAGRAARLLRQAARSLLLAQSSDWTFHLGRGGSTGYAESRIREQLSRFRFLIAALNGSEVQERQISALEGMDNLFPHLDLRHFR